MFKIHLFDLFRWPLCTVVTLYASIVTLQSIYGRYIYLSGGDKYVSMIRRYLLVHGLRLRIKSFWGDVLVCALLTVTFFMIWHAHNLIYQMDDTITKAH